MGSQLARRFKVDVSTDASTWLPFKGIMDLAPNENPTIQSTTDFDNNGFETNEKTVTSGTLTAKIRHIINAGLADPGQELARTAGQFQFADAVRLYVRWYDKYNGPEAWQCRSIVSWTPSKTGAADVEEVTVVFKADGAVTAITNPAGTTALPVITSVTSSPAAQVAGGLIRIIGANFTTPVATTGVKVGGVNATSWDLVSDSLIEAIVPAGTAGSAPILVTTTAGASNAFPYTRA
jgi:hypothetical protein